MVGVPGHHGPHGHPGGSGGRRRGRGDGPGELAGWRHDSGRGDPLHAPAVSGQDHRPVPGLRRQRGHPGCVRLHRHPERAGGAAVLSQPQRRRGGGLPRDAAQRGGPAERPGLHPGDVHRPEGQQVPGGADLPDGQGHLDHPHPGQGVRPDRRDRDAGGRHGAGGRPGGICCGGRPHPLDGGHAGAVPAPRGGGPGGRCARL